MSCCEKSSTRNLISTPVFSRDRGISKQRVYFDVWGLSNIFKNTVLIDGDITTIIAGKLSYKIKIDTDDLEKIKSYNRTVQVKGNRNNQFMYPFILVRNGVNKEGKTKNTSLMLSRLITNAGRGMVVDHINHDTMDNRKNNLRVIEPTYNSRNRNGANKNSISGHRNVSFINGKWTVQLQIAGKNQIFGRFNEISDAIRTADEMRNKYYGEFAGV